MSGAGCPHGLVASSLQHVNQGSWDVPLRSARVASDWPPQQHSSSSQPTCCLCQPVNSSWSAIRNVASPSTQVSPAVVLLNTCRKLRQNTQIEASPGSPWAGKKEKIIWGRIARQMNAARTGGCTQRVQLGRSREWEAHTAVPGGHALGVGDRAAQCAGGRLLEGSALTRRWWAVHG